MDQNNGIVKPSSNAVFATPNTSSTYSAPTDVSTLVSKSDKAGTNPIINRLFWKDGTSVFNDSNRQLAYEVYCIIVSSEFTGRDRKKVHDAYGNMDREQIIQSLVDDFSKMENTKTNNEKFIFDLVISAKEKKAYQDENNRLKTKNDTASGIYPCPKCRSYQTETRFVQMRGGDEPDTALNSCNKCNNKWNKN